MDLLRKALDLHLQHSQGFQTALEKVTNSPKGKRLFDLKSQKPGSDPNELLSYRYLCRGAGLLLAGPTGIGKSSAIMQMAMSWAAGIDFIDIHPIKPVKICLIQAENDEADLADMREGILEGMQLGNEQMQKCQDNILTFNDSIHSGKAFADMMEAVVKDNQPDLVIVDPIFAFLGGDASDQAHVSAFLRNQINPILQGLNVAGAFVHHTNKPPTGKEKANWNTADFAYAGSGSAEFANWARAVLAISATSQHDVFKLTAGKRGYRLGWQDDEGHKAWHKYIAHHPGDGIIHWHETDAPEEEEMAIMRNVNNNSIHPLTVFDVLKAIGDNGPKSARQIRENIFEMYPDDKHSKLSIRYKISDAVENGDIEPTGEKVNNSPCYRKLRSNDLQL